MASPCTRTSTYLILEVETARNAKSSLFAAIFYTLVYRESTLRCLCFKKTKKKTKRHLKEKRKRNFDINTETPFAKYEIE